MRDPYSTTEVWLSSGDVIELLEWKTSNDRLKLKRMRESNKITSRPVNNGLGRSGYEYLLSSLPEKAVRKWVAGGRGEEVGGGKLGVGKEEIEVMEFTDAYAAAPEYNRKQYDKYMSIIQAAGDKKGFELKDFINEWNMKHPDYKTSYGRVMAAKAILYKMGPAGLLADHGKRAGRSDVDNTDFEYFKSIYLVEGGPGAEACWLSTYGNRVKLDEGVVPDNFPKVSSFMRRLRKEIPEGSIYLARHGASNYNKKYASYINRDYRDILPGQVWVSDHKQADQAVMRSMPNDIRREVLELLDTFETEGSKRKSKDNPAYPWITAWRCFKTGKWLGWNVHIEDPNADHIFQAFFSSASVYGIPKEIIIDNGKDYRCKDFAGGRRTIKVNVDEIKVRSLVAGLHITPHFTIPYNGQSKPIERDFKVLKEWIDRGLPGFRGGNVVERPEALEENIKRGNILEFTEYESLMNFFIENVFHKYKSEGKNLLGRSRDEAFAKEFEGLTKVSDDALMLFCMRTSADLEIGRNGITVSRKYDLYYWADWMFGYKGRKAYMRRNVKKYQEAWVFDSITNEYLGKAYLNAWTANALVKTDLEKAHLENLLTAKRREVKIMKKYAETQRSVSGREYIENLAAGIGAAGTFDNEQQVKESAVFLKTKMDEAVMQERVRSTGTDDIPFSTMEPIKKNKKREVKAWFEE